MKLRRSSLWVTGLLLAAGAALYAQQQAAEAPATDRRVQTRPAVAGLHGLVTSGHPIASSAGLQMLLKGGNAFDAAVAVGVMAPLGEPEMNGIGGNGFATLYDKKSGKVLSLSMAGAAPKGLKPAEMTPESLNAGMNAGIVPGNLGGYLYLLDRFGTMSIGDVFAPAIEYAEKGYPIDPMLAADIERGKNNLSKYPTTAKIYLPGGQPLAAGDLLKNPDYAGTLRKLVDAEQQARAKGASRSAAITAAFDRFYKGDIAQEFDRFFKENGGVMRGDDLAAYEPRWSEPLHTTYRGYDVYSNPSTSRGGFEVLMQASLVEGFDLRSFGPQSAKTLHAEIEAIKVAKADIYRYVADPKFTSVPTEGLLSKDYAAKRRALIDPNKAGAYPAAGTPAGTAGELSAGGQRAGVSRTVRHRTAHDQLLDRRWLRQRDRHHAHARRPLRQQRRRRQHRAAVEQRHAARVDVAVSGRRQLRRRRQDSAAQQLAGGRAQGRQGRVRVRHAGRRNDRPDRVPGPRQPDRLRHAGAAGDRSAAVRARCEAELLQGRRRRSPSRSRAACRRKPSRR